MHQIFAYEFAQVSKISEIDWKDYMVCLTPTTTLATEQNSHGHNDRFTAIVQLASKSLWPLYFIAYIFFIFRTCYAN